MRTRNRTTVPLEGDSSGWSLPLTYQLNYSEMHEIEKGTAGTAGARDISVRNLIVKLYRVA
jgi:hypothetical protein